MLCRWNRSYLQRKLPALIIAGLLILLIYLLTKSNENLGLNKKRLPSSPLVHHQREFEDHNLSDEVNKHLQNSAEENIPNNPDPNEVLSEKEMPNDPYAGPRNKRQEAVVEAFQHAWGAYKKYAWGHDELRPISKSYQEWFGIGLTIIDSMDTMYIMGLKDEFKLSRDFVAKNLTFAIDNDVQLFEIVIRALGGLLSAYHLSDDTIFLDKALELGNRLMPCFNGPTKIPCNRVNLKTGQGNFFEISTAETGTLQLEFKDLAKSSGQEKFKKAMDDINGHLHGMSKMDNLVGCFINAQTGLFRMSSTVSVGASADSYYEYLLKQWLQTGQTENILRDDFIASAASIKKHLLRHTEPHHWGYVGAFSSMSSKNFRPDMEHLACFYPGTLALAYMSGLGDDYLSQAADITHTCYQMYNTTPTGLSPEVATMNQVPGDFDDILVNGRASFNLQRPEAVESIFYMYRATKDKKYQDWGWQIFQAFEKHMRIESGYTSISNVMATRPEHLRRRDKMETFYLAETLKYLYLLFSDDPHLMPLDQWVFNTEAHPLPVYSGAR